MNTGRWWMAVALICLTVIGVTWWQAVHRYAPAEGQLADAAAVRDFLDTAPAKSPADQPRIEVPTGVFVQSLRFENASDVHVTGYIWQTYDTVEHAALLDAMGRFRDQPGVVLPEQVAGGDSPLTEAYRRKTGTRLTIGWAVDVVVRQPFDYARYPLDRQHVWLRMWHRAFDRDVVLVPDLRAYDQTEPARSFGLDAELVPGGWRVKETYFRYVKHDYDTDFGIPDYVGQRGFPELYFEVVMGRQFINAFIIHLVPLFVVIVLLFSVIMTVTADEEQAGIFGFSTSGALGTSAALFFVVVVAHVQLRESLASPVVVYLEWFYLITYVAILLVSIDIYLFTAGRGRGAMLPFFRNDNLLGKLTFLPAVMISLAVVTVWFF